MDQKQPPLQHSQVIWKYYSNWQVANKCYYPISDWQEVNRGICTENRWGFCTELNYSTFIYSSQVHLRNKNVFWPSYSKLNLHKQAVSLLVKYLFIVTEIQQKGNKYFWFPWISKWIFMIDFKSNFKKKGNFKVEVRLLFQSLLLFPLTLAAM